MTRKANQEGRTEQIGRERKDKYLTFSLMEEEYGIGIRKIKEIIGMLPVTPIPRTPEFLKGVVNLRGKVIPVVDLRARFQMPRAEYTDRTCIIITEIRSPAGMIMIGAAVDSVSEVLSIRAADIESSPASDTGGDAAFILGIARTGGGIKILLDIDKVLTLDREMLLEQVA